jgi:tripartite-type tricarboxylate transporter receptor subunit TctC
MRTRVASIPLRPQGKSSEETMWSRLFSMAVAILASERAWAQDSAAQFYHGKQITIIVGSSAGGGFDIYARLLSRHMSVVEQAKQALEYKAP